MFYKIALISLRLGTVAVIYHPFPFSFDDLRLLSGLPQYIVPQTSVV